MSAPHALHPTDQTLSSYGLGKLDDAAAEAVNRHMESCPTCRRRVAELSSDSFLGRLREAQARPDAPAPIVCSTDGLSMLATGPSAPAPSPASTLPPGLAGHPDYEILRELDRGGMGVVYLAQNKLMSRPEVLKVVGSHLITRPEVLERFLREIRSAARLHHTNIVTAYAALRFGESLVLAMEYVEGLDLARIVKAKGPLPVANTCNYVHQAALGLQHAHEHGMVHRDIKPSNLMLAHAGKKAIVKVLDFGLAKVTSEGQAERGLTREGQMLGTPDYIAPEQIRDAQSADIRADIYSLGCTLYYLLAGRPPFEGENLWDLYQAHFSMDAGPLNLVRPEVPVELAALVGKMMAKEPGKRFQAPNEVAQALTPFFKPAAAQPSGSSAKVSRAISQARPTRTSALTPAPVTGPSVSQPPTPTHPEPTSEILIGTREPEPAPAIAQPSRPRPPWMWPAVAASIVLLGLIAAWAAGVFKIKTPEGFIVLTNLPDQAMILVDDKKATVRWPDGGGPAEITVVPGDHRVQVKKDGFTMKGQTVTVEAGGRTMLMVQLEPLETPLPGTDAADARLARAKVDKPPVVKSADRPKPGPIVLDNPPNAKVDEPPVVKSADRPKPGPIVLDNPPNAKVDKPPVVKSADRPKPGPIVLDNPPNPITNSIGMKLVLIPDGEFMMGSPEDDEDAEAEEKPRHRVQITRPFYLGVTEVTQGQYRAVMGKNPSHFKRSDDLPVEGVSWFDAVKSCNKLSEREGRKPYYRIEGDAVTIASGEGYRLPTEAEWEYACRAGTATRFSFGDNENALGQYAWYVDNSNGRTHLVGRKQPNAFGLYDMHGNVYEWCWDGYDANHYKQSPAVDPHGPGVVAHRVIRGGSLEDGPQGARSALRHGSTPKNRDSNLGFRLARDPSGR